MAGQEAVPSVNGPLARTLADISFYTKAIIDSEPWLVDPKCVPIPWRVVEPPSKLKIGVLWNDGVVTPTPPVKRALVATVEKLHEAGHEIVDWSPEGHDKALSLLVDDPLQVGWTLSC
jgi:amidase